VEYSFLELDEITLAYAITVHKSQGSEYPCIILPLTTSHYPLLQRNLLYTAITRASKLMIIIGSKQAMAMAIKNNRVVQRYTSLFKKFESFD
jgi:exodeoxyribonuclease V alpha subunit